MSRTTKSNGREADGGCPPLDWMWSIFDYARAKAIQLQRETQARLKWQREQAVALVAVDRLYFRVEPADAATPPATLDLAKQAFRSAFRAVWGRIPRPDRDCLLRYWRCDRAAALSLPTNPLLRVVEDTPWSPAPPRWARLGRELTFTFTEVTERPADLSREIATTLARVVLLADRRHWGLYLKLVEEPLARWEKRQGKKADEAKRDAKIDKLEQAHHKAYEREIGDVVRGWGVESAALPPWQRSGE
jgi:hypothetical protein